MTIALVMPAYNEAEIIEDTISQVRDFFQANPQEEWRLVVVDDGSSDETADLVKKLQHGFPGLLLVELARNFGHQAALIAGLEAIEATGYIIIDADLQDPLDAIIEMLDSWRLERTDTVRGVRLERKGESSLKIGLAKVFYRVFASLVPYKFPLDTGDFRLISRAARNHICTLGEKDIVLRAVIPWFGFKESAIEYNRRERKAGESKYRLRAQLALAARAVIGSSTKPLELIAVLAVASGFATLSYLGWIFWRALTSSELIDGWASTLATVLAIGTFQLFASGVIAAYLSKILSNTSGRPRYVLDSQKRAP